MAKEKKNKQHKRYRIAIIESDTHKNVFALHGTKFSISLIIIAIIISLIAGVLLLVSNTRLKELIPGYPSAQTRHTAIQNSNKIDSLQREIKLWSFQLINIQKALSKEKPIPIDSLISRQTSDKELDKLKRDFSKEDSLMRQEVINYEKFNLSNNNRREIKQIEGLLFFPPVKGVITEYYNLGIGHPYIDIATAKNSVISSILDGTIIFAGWTDESGFTIQIQHENNLVSVYKHNSKILKRTGDKVIAGSAIAIVGDSGKLSNGVHLHFELWHNGEPIDPTLYIKF